MTRNNNPWTEITFRVRLFDDYSWLSLEGRRLHHNGHSIQLLPPLSLPYGRMDTPATDVDLLLSDLLDEVHKKIRYMRS